MLQCCDDDLQFEWKEYLICIEHEALPNNLGSESTVPVQPGVQEITSHRNVKIVKTGDPLLRPKTLEVKTGDPLLKPKTLEVKTGDPLLKPKNLDVKTGDPLLKPKNLDVKTFSGCIDLILSALSNPCSVGGREERMSTSGEGLGKKRVAMSEMDDCMLVLESGDDSFALSKKIKQTLPIPSPTPNSINNNNNNNNNLLNETKTNRPIPQTFMPNESRFVLPSFQSIQQHDYSFYSLNPFPPPSSLSEYQQQLTMIAEAVIRNSLFTISSK